MSVRPCTRLFLAVGLASSSLGACDLSAPVLAASISAGVADTTIALRVGQEARVGGTVLLVTFLGVTNDSRCPSDVMCVWAGNAAVAIATRVAMGPTVRHVLNTTLDPRSADVGGYRVTLAGLRPYPVSTSRIPADRYVADLRFQRLVYGPD